uniref:MogA/MoaB family molybdenum cofactor biosynthesis protein n=1 Tax=Fervidicoccus fontis TaxID=683846 RepID=A0A7J3SL88_9CREN
MIEIVVVSDRVSSGETKDESGVLAIKKLEESGFKIDGIKYIGNSYKDILKTIRESNSRVILFIGGTGPSPRDITVDVVESLAWRKLPGFGEAFRMKSLETVGYSALISRSELFILHDGKVAIVLPGSKNAVELGLDILKRFLDHLLEEVERFEGPHEECSHKG